MTEWCFLSPSSLLFKGNMEILLQLLQNRTHRGASSQWPRSYFAKKNNKKNGCGIILKMLKELHVTVSLCHHAKIQLESPLEQDGPETKLHAAHIFVAHPTSVKYLILWIASETSRGLRSLTENNQKEKEQPKHKSQINLFFTAAKMISEIWVEKHFVFQFRFLVDCCQQQTWAQIW